MWDSLFYLLHSMTHSVTWLNSPSWLTVRQTDVTDTIRYGRREKLGVVSFLVRSAQSGGKTLLWIDCNRKNEIMRHLPEKKTLASFQTLRTREDRFLPNRVFTWSALRAYNNARAINRIFRPTLCWCACLSVRMCVKRAGCTVARVFCRLRC